MSRYPRHLFVGELSARTGSRDPKAKCAERQDTGWTLPKPRGGGGRSGGKAAAPRGGHGVGVDAPLSHAPAPNPEPSPGGHRPLPAAGSRRAQRGSASQEETSDRRPDSPRDSPRTPRAHGHGRGSGQGWRTPALHPQAWAPSAPKGAPGGSQLPPVRPARPAPAAGRRASWHRLPL